MVPVRSCTSTASGSEHEVLFSRAPSEREAGTRACCVFMPSRHALEVKERPLPRVSREARTFFEAWTRS